MNPLLSLSDLIWKNIYIHFVLTLSIQILTLNFSALAHIDEQYCNNINLTICYFHLVIVFGGNRVFQGNHLFFFVLYISRQYLDIAICVTNASY